jgi:hypothetical protein
MSLLKNLIKVDIASHSLGESLMHFENLRVLTTGNLSQTTLPPWITKLRVLNNGSYWKLTVQGIEHLTSLKALRVDWCADFQNFTRLTWLETLHVPEEHFPKDLDLQNLVNLRTLKFLPPSLASNKWLDWRDSHLDK